MPKKIQKLKEVNSIINEAIAKLETRAFLLDINNSEKFVATPLRKTTND
jgi:hypothetical protein